MFKTQHQKKYLGVYMLLVAIMGQLLYYIQAWKIFYTQSAEDISLAAYSVSCIALIHWIIYGFIIQDKIIIRSVSIGIIGAIIVIIGVIRYS